MSVKYFLDTNIFVYAVRPVSSHKTQVATQLISDGLDHGTAIVSYQVVQEFFNIAFRKFARPMSSFEAEEFFNTVFRPLQMVHSSPALFVSALQLYGKLKLSWYDSLIVAAALQAECSILYSEDMQDGRTIQNLKIENPFR
jgi:predicted nucleic acid-binding protein